MEEYLIFPYCININAVQFAAASLDSTLLISLRVILVNEDGGGRSSYIKPL